MTLDDMAAYFDSLAGEPSPVDRGALIDGCGSPTQNMNQNSPHQHQSSLSDFGLKSDLPRSFCAPLPPGNDD
jgi:hypothetical protein